MIRIARLQPLRGANAYSKSSLLVGTLEAQPGAAPQGLSGATYGGILAALGVPAAANLGETAPISRHVEAVCEAVRRSLGVDWGMPEPRATAAAEFLVPLDPRELSQGLADLAVGIVAAALAGRSGAEPHAEKLNALRAQLDQLRPDIQMRSIERECRRRGVPWRLMPWTDRLTQIGEGSRQIRMDLTETSELPLHASRAASDKAVTNFLLARHGLPVPPQLAIQRASDAWAAATRIGVPVAVKPRNGRKGKAVSTGLRQREEIEKAAQAALLVDTRIVVEKHVPGLDHRIFVAFGQVIAVSQRRPAHVVGDGVHSIADLVAIENRNPARARGKTALLNPIAIDADTERVIAGRGYRLDSVPPAGETIVLKSRANHSTGGTSLDLTADIHPDNATMAVRAAQIIGLDVAGVDFICPDITRSFREVGGGICEVNSKPGFRTHLSAVAGAQTPVVPAFLDALLPRWPSWRVPVVLLYGSAAARLHEMANLLGNQGLGVGLSGPDGLSVDGFPLPIRPRSLHEAHMLLTEDRAVDVVVMQLDPNQLESGLGCSDADLAFAPHDPAVTDRDVYLRHVAILERAGATIVESDDPSAALDAFAHRKILPR